MSGVQSTETSTLPEDDTARILRDTLVTEKGTFFYVLLKANVSDFEDENENEVKSSDTMFLTEVDGRNCIYNYYVQINGFKLWLNANILYLFVHYIPECSIVVFTLRCFAYIYSSANSYAYLDLFYPSLYYVYINMQSCIVGNISMNVSGNNIFVIILDIDPSLKAIVGNVCIEDMFLKGIKKG